MLDLDLKRSTARGLVALALGWAGAGMAPAQEKPAAPAPKAVDWAARTEADIAAIDGWMREAYPGFVDPETPEVPVRWSGAYGEAQKRAARVTDYGGWRATVFALVNAAHDGHVGLGETSPSTERKWAGIVLERRGETFLARRPAESPLPFDPRVPDGARLLSCDGEPAEAALAKRLDGFVTDWSIPAQRSAYASSLFIDRGNPFAAPPRRCSFEIGGKPIEIELRWNVVDAKAVNAAIAPYRRIKRQTERVDLTFAPGGSAWITLGNLGDFAAYQKLKAEVAARKAEILAAPYLVFDLRGNGGGDSSLGDALARELWGEAAFVPAPAVAEHKRWRASPLVAETMRAARDKMATSANPNPGLISLVDALLPALGRAIAEKAPLVLDPGYTDTAPDPEPAAAAVGKPAPRHARPVYVLTDGGCFSSCILTYYMLKRMGAVHIGDPTGVHTVFGESWFQRPLPSGQGAMMIPMAILAYPRDLVGGETPEMPWPGASDDEAGLTAWIAADAAKRSGKEKKG